LLGHMGRANKFLSLNDRFEPVEAPRKRKGSNSTGKGGGSNENEKGSEGKENESGELVEGSKVGIWKPPHPDSIQCNTGNQLPNARLVSRTIHVDLDAKSHVDHLLPMFAQFVCHDLMHTNVPTFQMPCCQLNDPNCMPIIVPPGDNIFSANQCLEFKRATSYCFQVQTERRYQNKVSAFIDAENIYGNDLDTSRQIRAPLGKLLEGHDHLLPFLNLKGEFNNKFTGGDSRASDNPALATIHTIFMREHNRIADQIFTANRLLEHDQV